MKKFDFKLNKEKLQDAIHQKKSIVEEMEKKLETLKRLVEENKIEEIEQIFIKGQNICVDLHSEFDKKVEEVFNLQNQEQELIKELAEIEKEINDLTTEKNLVKQDVKKKQIRGKYLKDWEIRTNNRRRDDETLKVENLPLDSRDFHKWAAKVEEIDVELEKYLGIYLDVAKVTCFDEQKLKNLSEVDSKKEKLEENSVIYLEKEIFKRSPEEIQKIIRKMENWVNMLVTVQKRNTLSEIEHKSMERPLKKSPEYKKRNSRRFSRKNSNRKSVVSTNSKSRKVGRKRVSNTQSDALIFKSGMTQSKVSPKVKTKVAQKENLKEITSKNISEIAHESKTDKCINSKKWSGRTNSLLTDCKLSKRELLK